LCLIAGLCLGALALHAQITYEQAFSFGIGNCLCQSPYGTLVEAANGYLYGTTSDGGRAGEGAVFRVKTDGSEFSILHDFGQVTADGKSPKAGLTLGEDDFLYGTTEGGGDFYLGTVFRIKLDGTGFSVLHTFDDEPDSLKRG
jgi:uncharacterized repeat protein (TIGR03803 family)